MTSTLLLQPGTLWSRTISRTQEALACGALHSIPTESQVVEQAGIQFVVRILTNLVRKDEARQQQQAKAGKGANPFLPYEKDLFVADISNTHVCILNKFNVVDYHLLIITRAFEEQTSLLTLQDFEATLACLAEFDGLVFYNGGSVAGASQPHKHLQMVPLPLGANGVSLPIAPLLATVEFHNQVGSLPQLPFIHALAPVLPEWLQSPTQAAEAALASYHHLLQAVGLRADGPMQSGPYNLLATRQWLMMVPRSQECVDSISINALGFAGALLVRNAQQMQFLKEQGPLTVLSQAAVSHLDLCLHPQHNSQHA
jgi:ATP adenylyltransferase